MKDGISLGMRVITTNKNMNIEEIPKLVKEIEGLAHVRCGECLRIVIGKDIEGKYWLPWFEHECWKELDEVEVERLDLGGHCGVLLTVRKEVIGMTIKMVECEECDGTGQVEKECPTCGQTTEIDCDLCGGSGEVEEEEEVN